MNITVSNLTCLHSKYHYQASFIMSTFIRLIGIIIITIPLWGGFVSCSDDVDEGPRFPVVEFYYKGNCIGIINEGNQYGNIEILEPLVGRIGEKIEIETRLISGTSVFLYNNDFPEYISVKDTHERDLTIGSTQIRELSTFSFEINRNKSDNDKFVVDIRAGDNNGPNSPSVFCDFYITINVRGE